MRLRENLIGTASRYVSSDLVLYPSVTVCLDYQLGVIMAEHGRSSEMPAGVAQPPDLDSLLFRITYKYRKDDSKRGYMYDREVI